MSDSWLKSLPPDLQKLVIDGVTQAAQLKIEFNKYLDIPMTKEFIKSGVINFVLFDS